MELSRPKTKSKKSRKKVQNESGPIAEQSGSCEVGTSLSDELHQAMQDIAITDIPRPDPLESRTDSPAVESRTDSPVVESRTDSPTVESRTDGPAASETRCETPERREATPDREPTPQEREESTTDKTEPQEVSSAQNRLYPHLEAETELQCNTISEASAPPVSLTNQVTPSQSTIRGDVNKSYLDDQVLRAIKPFTETQLAALYYNHEIDFAKEYVKEFVESQKSLQSHKFYEILSTYLRCRSRLIASQLDVDNLAKECKVQEQQIWSIEEAVVTESGKCQDGNAVSVSHKYPVASMNRQSLSQLGRSLASIRDLANEVFTLHAYSAEVLRLQIEHYIQQVLIYFCNIPHNSPVQLLSSCSLQKTELCTCISIIFAFQRRQIKDEQFLSDTREWLLRLGATLLRVATAQDHLFLLHHVLRSPGGVSNWAIPLVQIPLENLVDNYPSTSSALLDHSVTFLSVLMNPIYEREQFINDKRSLDEPWVFLDSDGDEEDDPRGFMSLLENDLVAILNQLPIDCMFRHVLGIGHQEHCYPENISQNSLLQLFAFATTMVQLLRTGLQTYNTPRYRQFAKRLGRLVRHTVQYVSDQWEVFRNTPAVIFDAAMLARLQVEYDGLVLRATQCIFSSQRLGAWQFLAVIPYGGVSSGMLWRLFCLLHQEYQEFLNLTEHQTTGEARSLAALWCALIQSLPADWRAETQKANLRQDFECKLSGMPEAEAYFLLNTFAAMALARGAEDADFIQVATLDLFQVGFVSKATQESCSKTARSLLANLTTKHPCLISDIFASLKQQLESVGTLSLYLMKELPLHLWTPNTADTDILAEWLLSPPSSLQSSVARSMLAALDWARLEPPLQLKVAILAVEACLKHAPERSGHTSPGGVAEGKCVPLQIRTNSTPEQGLNAWAWGLLSRLRLHLNDLTVHVPLTEALQTIPDIELDPSLEVLARGIREKEPIACFATLLATSWGHSIPLICSKGVPLLSLLLTHSKYDALCEALHHILPLFLDCSESLTSSDKFLQLFVALITADRGYVKMAKNLLLTDSPGPRAAGVLKVPPVATGSLAIYRWAQQALDTCLDHPLLPLFWQRFFHLYLAKVPVPANTAEKGALGSKFFEGMLNASYLKKLKRRLHDASELYDTRAAEPEVSGEGAEEAGGDRRALYARTAKILRTFGLWLEEGMLQEPNLFLPALPPQYDPNRLALVFAGDMSLWMEFMDVQEVQEKQMDAVRDWQIQHFRSVELSLPMGAARKTEESSSPLTRMLKRLQSYDHPKPAPPLKTARPVVPFLAREDLLETEHLMAGLKQQCDSLLEFAQVHALRTSELAALDCALVELFPLLYRDSEVRVFLSGGCEAQARNKSSQCAGLFKITIKVSESKLNEGTEHQMRQNRGEHAGLLARGMQPPPQRVCGAAVYMENVVSKLVTETNVAFERDDNFTIERLRETGVALFYLLVAKYTEETAFYPPTKQLLTSCIEVLGQVFVSRDEGQCEPLLTAILNQPHLSGLLSPHLSPQLAPTPAFLAMYRKVVAGCQSNPDSSFAVLSKFDVPGWLVRKRPFLRERSQFIETLGEALAASGKDPPLERMILHEKFLRHLRHILLHDFPEHYGEVLQLVLKLSEAQALCLDAWWSLLDCLTPQELPGLRPGPLVKEQLRLYATQQRLLGPQEVRDTATLLATYFTKERLQYGLHGLYPKYRHYIEPLSVFLGMMGHSLVIATLHLGKGALGDTLSEQIWPTLMELFSPWLIPYSGQRLRQQSAAWIQQLADDKSVLLPWIAQDASLSKLMSDSFVDIIQFLLDTLPACNNILCFVWQFYVMNFTLPAVKEHVLNVVHASFSRLPWERFWPRGQDVDAMLKLVEQYLPNCHCFMGAVFVQVSWVAWTQQVQALCTPEHLIRSHSCLMHLLVKLAAEPSVKQNPKCLPLIVECRKQLSWHLIDSSSFDTVLNWFVMSCDPRVILPSHTDTHAVDTAVLELLQEIAAAAGNCSTMRKRLAFVRSCGKMLVSSASRHKTLLVKTPQAFGNAAHRILDQVEAVNGPIAQVNKQAAESALLLGEVLAVTSVSPALAAVLVPASCDWLQRRSGRSAVVRGLLKCLGVSVSDPKVLGTLMEESIMAFFRDPGAPNISWLHCLAFLQAVAPLPRSQQQAWEPLEHTLVKEGHLLSLHALLLKRHPQEKTEQAAMLASLVEWLSAVKMSESVEHKLPMLWKLAFSLSLSLCEKSVSEDGTLEPALVQKLNQLAQYLTGVGEDKGWGLLGVIGLRRQPQASIKLKLLARTLAAFLLVQLPSAGEGDKRFVRLTADAPGALGTISSSCLSESLEPPAPTSQALQAVAALESLGSAKLNPPELKLTLDEALAAVRNPEHSLTHFSKVFFPILSQLYQDPFLTR
ncbi:hypothetical protein B566_EDAN005578 [Ephemera danica]|nr:hypothetical protein B566_EDAN005578 [Ephemera danica]